MILTKKEFIIKNNWFSIQKTNQNKKQTIEYQKSENCKNLQFKTVE